METEITKNTNKKILIAFDLDYTILSTNTCMKPIKSHLNEVELTEFKNQLKAITNYIDQQRLIFQKLKEKLADIEKVKQAVQTVTLNKGFEKLFDFIKINRSIFTTIVITGSNSLFLDWALEKYDISELFESKLVHKSEVDEEEFIKIEQMHTHDCQICNVSQCKGQLLREYIEQNTNADKFYSIIYVGDGDNDFCPAKALAKSDYLFPREDWGLHKKLKELKPGELQCENVILWRDGEIITETLKSLISNN